MAPRKDYQRVLCMCLAGVGDALNFTPFIRHLRQAKPGITIDVLVMFHASESMYASNPDVNEVLFVDFVKQSGFKSLWQTLKLRRRKYDACVCSFPANRAEYNIVQIMLGGRSIGHRYLNYDITNLNWLKQDWLMEGRDTHNVVKNAQLLKFFDVPVPDKPCPLVLVLTDDDRSVAHRWLTDRGLDDAFLIGFHAGTAIFKNHIKRRWAPEKFGGLAQRLVDEMDARVLVFGGPEEDDLKHQIVQLSRREDRVHSVDGTSLRQSAALMERCNLFVSNDSALMHVAGAVGTPVVGIFAYTNWHTVYPWRVPHRIVRQDLPCSPCFFYSPKPAFCHAHIDYACNSLINVDDVYQAVRNLHAETKQKSGARSQESGGVISDQ
jgi:heptosyltransferase-2